MQFAPERYAICTRKCSWNHKKEAISLNKKQVGINYVNYKQSKGHRHHEEKKKPGLSPDLYSTHCHDTDLMNNIVLFTSTSAFLKITYMVPETPNGPTCDLPK